MCNDVFRLLWRNKILRLSTSLFFKGSLSTLWWHYRSRIVCSAVKVAACCLGTTTVSNFLTSLRSHRLGPSFFGHSAKAPLNGRSIQRSSKITEADAGVRQSLRACALAILAELFHTFLPTLIKKNSSLSMLSSSNFDVFPLEFGSFLSAL